MTAIEILRQEEAVFAAKKEVEKAEFKSKVEILLKFTNEVFDFLEIIHNDPNYLFSGAAYPKDADYKQLLGGSVCNFEYYRGILEDEINKDIRFVVMLGSFNYNSRIDTNLYFGISCDFEPWVKFNEVTHYSIEGIIRALSQFFIKHRKSI